MYKRILRCINGFVGFIIVGDDFVKLLWFVNEEILKIGADIALFTNGRSVIELFGGGFDTVAKYSFTGS